jgi:hypothetical protein
VRRSLGHFFFPLIPKLMYCGVGLGVSTDRGNDGTSRSALWAVVRAEAKAGMENVRLGGKRVPGRLARQQR